MFLLTCTNKQIHHYFIVFECCTITLFIHCCFGHGQSIVSPTKCHNFKPQEISYLSCHTLIFTTLNSTKNTCNCGVIFHSLGFYNHDVAFAGFVYVIHVKGHFKRKCKDLAVTS